MNGDRKDNMHFSYRIKHHLWLKTMAAMIKGPLAAFRNKWTKPHLVNSETEKHAGAISVQQSFNAGL